MNIALLKETLQRDEGSVGSSSLLVNGHVSDSRVHVTNFYWWQVDLMFTFEIGRIVILKDGGSFFFHLY